MLVRGQGWTLAAAIAVLCALAPPAVAQEPGPGSPPPGANDACRADQRPTPVVLVHGTFSTRGQFFKFSPQLESARYCVFALNYGCTSNEFSCGRGPIERSARQLRSFINDRVLPQSRSGKVSILGHSQGGLMPRYYIKFLGGRTKVKDMVSISASNHGTDNPFAPFAPRDCVACDQQVPYMSAFTKQLNSGDETAGPIDYTQIQTRFDDVVFPYFSAFLTDDADNNYNGPRTRRMNGPRTANVCLQDRFVANTDDHISAGTTSDQALLVAEEALRRDGPARVVRPDSVCAKLGGDPGGGSEGSGGERPPCTISGTAENDVLVGTSGDDVICAGGGNDVVHAAGGDDQVFGGGGNDTLRGDEGNDDLFGEGGNDAIGSHDEVRGNDSVNGGSGRDACDGDFGDAQRNCP